MYQFSIQTILSFIKLFRFVNRPLAIDLIGSFVCIQLKLTNKKAAIKFKFCSTHKIYYAALCDKLRVTFIFQA